MAFTLRYHLQTRPALEQLRASLGTTEEQRDRRYARLVLTIWERFRQFDGSPPEATPETTERGPIFWMAVGTNLLIQFVVRERPRAPVGRWDMVRRLARWWRGVTREVTIIGLLPVISPVEAPPPDSSTAPE
jgi:hypothetical protein